MVLSTVKVHISYWACGVGSGFRPWPLWQRPRSSGTRSLPAQPLKAALPQREGSVSHRHLGSGSNSYVIFFKKEKRKNPIFLNVIEPQREHGCVHCGPFRRAWRNACVDRLYPQGGMRFPKASSGGLAPAECKDHSVFIFISEEIKKKTLGINVKQVFLLLFLSWCMKLRWWNVKLDGNAEVVTPD